MLKCYNLLARNWQQTKYRERGIAWWSHLTCWMRQQESRTWQHDKMTLRCTEVVPSSAGRNSSWDRLRGAGIRRLTGRDKKQSSSNLNHYRGGWKYFSSCGSQCPLYFSPADLIGRKTPDRAFWNLQTHSTCANTDHLWICAISAFVFLCSGGVYSNLFQSNLI